MDGEIALISGKRGPWADDSRNEIAILYAYEIQERRCIWQDKVAQERVNLAEVCVAAL